MGIFGMLWCVDDPTAPLEESVRAAAKWYVQRYHAVPNTCLVCFGATGGKEILVDGISVIERKYIQPGYILIGVDDDEHQM